jgi:hypothetical protein
VDENAATRHRGGAVGLDPDDPDFATTVLDVVEELAHQWGKWPEEILRMPWVKLKRWIDVYLKRRRREWKLQCALTSMGVRSQMGGLMGGGGGAYEEMSDDDRLSAFAELDIPVVRRRVD